MFGPYSSWYSTHQAGQTLAQVKAAQSRRWTSDEHEQVARCHRAICEMCGHMPERALAREIRKLASAGHDMLPGRTYWAIYQYIRRNFPRMPVPSVIGL